MSIPVPVEELSETIGRYGRAAFLLTTSDDGRPHATHVVVESAGAILKCELGRRTARNAVSRSKVSFLWPATEPGGYSLIVDGEIEVTGQSDEGGTGAVTASKAVLHRPAPGEDSGEAPCGSEHLHIDVG